jgi:alpha-tubulin suppressor-like RCC1 family protein
MFVSDGYLYFCGKIKYELFDKLSDNIFDPIMVTDNDNKPIINVAKMAISNYTTHMLIISDGFLYISGSNYKYKLGLDDTNTAIRPPTKHSFFMDKYVTDVACSEQGSFVVADKTLYYAGEDDYGTFGDLNIKIVRRFTPIPFFEHLPKNTIDQMRVRASNNVVGVIIDQ